MDADVCAVAIDDFDDMDEIIEEFLVEGYETLDTLDRELVELEEHPDSAELLASIFRSLHTIKGTAGFLGFSNLESVTHAGENLLSLLRSGELQLTTATADALLATVDATRSMMDSVHVTKTDGDETHAELVEVLHGLAHLDVAEPEAQNVETSPPLEVLDSDGDPLLDEIDETPETTAPELEIASVCDEASVMTTPEPEVAPMIDEPVEANTSVANHESEFVGPEASGEPPATSISETSIRVDVGLLDRLMNLVGELVLARNQVLQHHANTGDSTFQATSQQLDLITTELQEGVMKTRMQPIGNVWSKFPRVVRDLATHCSKKVRLEMEGEDTELDKTLLEAIKDPLTHIVRNSVDHGLEAPEVRLAAGKSEVGLLKLRAYHEGGQVIIEIVDDGAGLNLDRIRAKAVSSGIMSAERVASLSDRDVSHLIFRPGFSTAQAVTNVSGRGVGMDVVKTNVEKIGGSLEIQSQPGLGTTLTIKIPLTLAIIPALVITGDGARYLIPQINLVEVLRVDGGTSETKIEMAGEAPVLRLRGNLLPVVHLSDVLGLPRADDAQDGVNIAVLNADGSQFGLVVDQINDTEEIVVKPLSPHLKGLIAFAGTTIMGDGAVSLILDANGIGRLGNVLRSEDQTAQTEDATESGAHQGSIEMVLVCSVGESRVGIPLARVSRLEELPVDQIERAAGRDVLQYRDRLLRLLYLGDMLDPGSAVGNENRDVLQVLVLETEDAIYGLVVDEIIDVVETDVSTGEAMDLTGLRTSVIIGKRVTDLLDIDEIVAMAGARPALAGSGVH